MDTSALSYHQKRKAIKTEGATYTKVSGWEINSTALGKNVDAAYFALFKNDDPVESPIIKEIAPGLGMSGDELEPPGTNPDKVAQDDTLLYYRDMAKEPMIKAGIRHRDVSYLWNSANTHNREDQTKDPTEWMIDRQLLAGSPDPQDIEIWQWTADILDYKLKRGMKQVFEQFQRNAMVYGVAVGEIDWQQGNDGKVYAADIWDRDFGRFWYDPPSKSWYLREHWETSLEGMTKLPPRKFLFYSPYFYQENFYGESELNCLVKAYYGKSQVKKYCERFLEKWGSGQLYAKYPSDYKGKEFANERQQLLDALIKLRNQGASIFPDDVSVDVLQSEGLGDLFISYLAYLDDEIGIAMTGNNMSLKAPSVGSLALSENTANVSNSDYERRDASALQFFLNRTLLVWQTDWNWTVERYPHIQLINPESVKPTEKQEEPTQQEEAPQDIGQMPEPPKMPEEEQDFIEIHTQRTVQPDQHQNIEPPLYTDELVQDAARQYLLAMPSYSRREFDKLKPEQRIDSFTVTELRGDTGIIDLMKQEITETLPEQDEVKAWKGYQGKVLKLFKAAGVDYPDMIALFISFRNARQRALNEGIKAYVAANIDSIWGLEYITQDDIWVRHSHFRMHGVIRPPDDSIWIIWWPQNGHGCRCTIHPISYTEYEQRKQDDPTFGYTDELPTVWPDPGFGAGGI
jgi:hypothetical protein